MVNVICEKLKSPGYWLGEIEGKIARGLKVAEVKFAFYRYR